MSTLSVPLNATHEAFIKNMIEQGKAPNKAEVVRQALLKYEEDQAVSAVLESEQEYTDGLALEGNLQDLLNAMP